MRYGRRFKGKRSRGIKAKIASRRAFRKLIRKPKIVVVKKYANTVGQIAFRRNSLKPSRSRRFSRRRGRRGRRY